MDVVGVGPTGPSMGTYASAAVPANAWCCCPSRVPYHVSAKAHVLRL